MHVRATLRWFAVGALVLGAAGSATAQPAQPARAGGDANAQVGFERRPRLSPQEELNQADAILTRIDTAAGAVRRQLEAARAARDVVRTLCLNDKLSQVDVANRSARDRQSALQAAVQRSDAELSNHEFTILTVLRQRVEQLTAEANQCLGEDMTFLEKTVVGVTYPTNLPDPLDNPPAEDTSIPPGMPVCVTCTGGP